ncbi:MAG: glycosyltransferase family 39 protein [Chloroflexi bacterium]|nr:MAG: glycosyltransferase family 39 protein [Chloroflexota bacterium]
MGRTAWLLGLLVLLLYVVTGSGHIQTIDFQLEQDVAQRIVHLHNFTTQWPIIRGAGAVAGVDGQHFAPHGLGMSLLLVPLTLLTDAVRPGDTAAANFVASFVDAILAAATAVVLFLLARDLGARTRVALGTALILAVATLEWPYAHALFDVTATGFLILVAVFAAHRFALRGGAGWLALSGGALGGAVLVRTQSVIVVPALAAYVLWTARPAGPRRVLGAAAAWGLPLAAGMATVGWYNWVRFANPFNDGHGDDPNTSFHTPLLEGLSGLLASPGKSLLLFSPVLLLAILGIPRFTRRHRALAITSLAIVAVNLLLNAKVTNWTGDDAWGPRFMVPVLALMLLPVLGWFEAEPRRWRIGLTAGLCTASVAVQLLGVGFDYLPLVDPVRALHKDVWNARYAQVTVHALAATDRLHLGVHDPIQRVGTDPTTDQNGLTIDLWWVHAAHRDTHRLLSAVAVLAMVAGMAGAALALLLRLRPPPRPPRLRHLIRRA